MNCSLSERELAEALGHSRDGFMVADGNGIVLYFNESYVRLTNLEGLIYIGVSLQDLVDRKVIDGSACMRAIKKKATAVEIHSAKRNMIVCASVPVFDDDGSVRYVSTSVQDGTDYLNLYDDIQRNNAMLADLAQSISEKASHAYGVIAVNDEMCECLERAKRIAVYDVSVLILGESGVGKDVVAHYLHNNSTRKDKPFVSINCGAIPENLLETELFGYAEGTFTGQVRGGKNGLLSAAEGGTLFLDEIGDMPLILQAKVLHVLETNTYRPIGSTKVIRTNVRFLYATNRNLLDMTKEKTFRDDLYYRINVASLTIPALRDRKEDIYPLSLYYLDHYNKKYNLHKQISHDVIQRLAQYDWPGNVRELKNMIETMVVLSPGTQLELPQGLNHFELSADKIQGSAHQELVKPNRNQSETESEGNGEVINSLGDYLDQQEKEYLLKIYRQVGTTRGMAKALNVNHSTIMRKLKKYNIHLK